MRLRRVQSIQSEMSALQSDESADAANRLGQLRNLRLSKNGPSSDLYTLGWPCGLFGMTILSALMLPMYYIHVPHTFSTNPEGRLEDIFFAWEEIKDQPWIAVALGGTIVSIAFFNFAGVSVTKELSATTRMVLDSVRTLLIWAFSIPFFGEQFIPLQLIGFGLLILGMFVYNDIYIGPWFRRRVLPNMGDSIFTRCCFSICGADLSEADRESLLNDDE